MFEIVQGSYGSRKLELLGKGQAKVSARVDLNTACKKVLSATAKCYLTGTEKEDSGGVKINGKVVTRIIYVDEFDGFNSEEKVDVFSERLVVKGGAAVTMNAAAVVLETSVADNAGQSVEVDSIIDLVLVGLTEKEVKYVAGVTGQAEARLEKTKLATFERSIEEKFSADEKLELDKNCAGVLGVDCGACVRDIYSDDGRVTIKGTVSANVITLKNGETVSMHNTIHEFDFTKTVHLSGLTAEDTVVGNITVAGVTVKAENKAKPELYVEVDLVFNGYVVVVRELEYVKDAFSNDFALNFTNVSAEHTNALQQTNTVADVEGNMTMPVNAPFIARILMTSGAHITGVNMGVADGKVTVEGVLAATVIYECEEKQIHTHEAGVAFSTTVRIDGISDGFSIQAALSVVNCYVKARRGKELMIDAKLGISISASESQVRELVADITQGEAKVNDDSAIVIYSVETGETLWDVAKRISMPCAEIVKQNPSCEKGLAAGDKIFIYRQQVINF